MKRTCNGCRAYDDSLNGCLLGYKTQPVEPPVGFEGGNMGSKPLVECPKPKTYDHFIKLTSLSLKGGE